MLNDAELETIRKTCTHPHTIETTECIICTVCEAILELPAIEVELLPACPVHLRRPGEYA